MSTSKPTFITIEISDDECSDVELDFSPRPLCCPIVNEETLPEHSRWLERPPRPKAPIPGDDGNRHTRPTPTYATDEEWKVRMHNLSAWPSVPQQFTSEPPACCYEPGSSKNKDGCPPSCNMRKPIPIRPHIPSKAKREKLIASLMRRVRLLNQRKNN